MRAPDSRSTGDDRWTGYQRWLVFLTALTIVFDGFDNQLLGIAIPQIMREWNVPRSAFSPVVSFGLFGMMIGGAGAGLAGDRFGRKVALLGSMLLFGASTTAVSLVDTVTSLGLLRFVALIGIGGAIPNAASLAAEYVSPRHRPLAVTLTIVCVPLGGVLAGLLAVPGLPAVGWRGMFAIGGAIPIVFALILTRILPESQRFLESAGERLSVRSLFTRDFRIDTFALWVAFFSCLLAVYLAFSWLPSILASAGLGPAVASTSLTAFNLGGVVGAILGGVVITRFGSRRPMIAMATGAAAGAVVMAMLPISSEASVLPILVMLTITGGLINAAQTTMYALAASVYPTALRATGVGAASAFGRIGAVLSGYAGPWTLEIGGSWAFFLLMAATMVVCVLALSTVRRHIPARGHD